MILYNLSSVPRDNFWKRNCFCCYFFISQFGFWAKLSGLFKKIFIGWKHFLPRVPRTFGEKKFSSKFFFKFFLDFERQVYQTFDVLLIDRAFKIAFLLPEDLCDAEQFFPSEWDDYKNLWPPTVKFLDFWRKRLAGILEFNYSCPDELSEKKHLFHKKSYFHESFRTLGEKFSKLCATLFGRAIEKATFVSKGTLWRKTKCFKCFRERCFLRMFTDYDRKSLHFRKKIVLVLKTLFYVFSGTFLEKIFVSKNSSFL